MFLPREIRRGRKLGFLRCSEDLDQFTGLPLGATGIRWLRRLELEIESRELPADEAPIRRLSPARFRILLIGRTACRNERTWNG